MFGKDKQETLQLQKQIASLEKKLGEVRQEYQAQLDTLKKQVAQLASGLPPHPKSVLEGLPYSEIAKEEVVDFIKSVPDLLILDVRSDQGWSQGHIPGAKHVPASEVFSRLNELSDKSRPILTICANGNTALTVCQMLAREGYQKIFNALGGMAGYPGDLTKPEIRALDIQSVEGPDRELVKKVLEVLDRDVRPGLKRDGGDIQVLSVEDGVVKVKMVGACVGCGAQKRTVEDGIKTHLQKLIPEIKGVVDLSMGIAN